MAGPGEILEYAPPLKWYQRRKWRNAVFVSLIVVGAIVTGFVAWNSYGEWYRRNRQPNSEWQGDSMITGRLFQTVECRVWKTEGAKLFYGICVGSCEFEPILPRLSYTYSYDYRKGGSLTVDGKPIAYSRTKRLLALNPFGEMEEIALSGAETRLVESVDGVAIWEKVVLPRLYRFTGKDVDGKRVGHWVCCDSTGRKAYEGDYIEGHRDAKWTYYYPSGRVRVEASYSKGQRHGKWDYFDMRGKVLDTITWREDYPVGRSVSEVGLGHRKTIGSP